MRVGIIGGGLMGREAASAFGRWFVLDREKVPVRVELTAVCDLQPSLLEWFKGVPGVRLLTRDHRELLASADVDAAGVARVAADVAAALTQSEGRRVPCRTGCSCAVLCFGRPSVYRQRWSQEGCPS